MIEILRQHWLDFLGQGFPENLSGLSMTLWILVLCFVLAFAFSLPLSIMQASRKWYLSWPVKVYTYVFRATPLYVQLLTVYTGFFSLAFIRETPMTADFFRSGFNCVIFAFSINECAYLTQILAGSIRAVPAGEIEAAYAAGFSRPKMLVTIVLPSALRRSLPYYSNEVILLLHSTAIAFTASVPELLKVARDVSSQTYAPFAAYGSAALFYAAVAFMLIATFRRLERRLLRFQQPS